jgi:putative transposase
MEKTMYKVNRHSCYSLEYHLVVVTKYRHPVIVGELQKRLIEIAHSIIENDWGCTISAINTDKDHIHILFEAKPQVQLSKLANNYKTVSSRLIRKEFADSLKPYYWKPYFWSDSYFVCTVSDRTHNMVEMYIHNQGR